jgi:hypothetical protein
MMPRRFLSSIAIATMILAGQGTAALAQSPRFEVRVSPAIHSGALTGRLVIAVSKNAEAEPRLLISLRGPALFGTDVEQLAPGDVAVVDESAIGYPFRLGDLPPGEYYVQAVVNVYDRVERADGHVLWLPMNDGRQEFFSVAAGNLYSDVQRVDIGAGGTIRLEVAHSIPSSEPPGDTEWVRRVSIESPMLSEFWGRPIYIHATVLLPRDYDARTDVRYPAVYTLGHSVPFGFSTDSTRFRTPGQINPVTGVETGFDFYRSWISDDFPRVIAISFQQQTPYFPDSYSVNSANNGPYGDAVVQEAIPYLERQFRIIPQSYARLVEGASTGGWQTLALQLQHPDYFGGAWVLQPDPIDFRSYQLVNIYEDENAFEIPEGMFITTERPFRRSVSGQPLWSLRQLSLFEAVLGSRGRSGYQLGGWEAVYGPTDADGYPKPLWDPLTGMIDRSVAEYMRDNGFDLRAYAEREWATLGPKIEGKLHFFVPDMDDFYLNVPMYRFEEFLRNTSDPHYPGEWVYGRPMKGHSWHDHTWAEMVRRMARHIRENAPPGEETAAWNY